LFVSLFIYFFYLFIPFIINKPYYILFNTWVRAYYRQVHSHNAREREENLARKLQTTVTQPNCQQSFQPT